LHVVGRKVLSLENWLRLDVVGFQDVAQENRDVARVVAREVLAAMDGRANPSVLGVGWSVKARRTLMMGTFTVSLVG
jgi:hypothetical protein